MLAAIAVSTLGTVSAQSYYDDDIYYDSSKEPKQSVKVKQQPQQQYVYSYPVADYPSADNYTVSGTRNISVDEYNRRGLFASDSLSNDTTQTDFTYTRRIEQFYNPEIVSGSNDADLAGIYYNEPAQVNIIVNTPSSYWGYDYFYPSYSWYSPYWNPGWRWGSYWYWNSWYDPYWAWGPSWGWGPSWRPGGWNRPYNPRHPGAFGRPNGGVANRPNAGTPGVRPGLGTNGNRHHGATGNYNGGYGPGNTRPGLGVNNGNVGTRPSGTNSGNRRPGLGTGSGSSRPSNSGVNTRPSNNNNNNNYSRPANTSGGRSSGYNSGSYGGGSRGGGYSGGGRSGGGRSSGGGRGRH